MARLAPWTIVGAGTILAAICLALALSWLGKPFPGFLLERNLTVTSVYSQQWSGFRAGIQVGDQVMTANGQELRHPADLDRLVRALPVGTEVFYDIRHDGATRRLQVPTAEFTAFDAFAMFVMWWVLGLVFLVLGGVVAFFRPQDAAARAFLTFCAVFALFSLTNFESVTTHVLAWVNILSLAFVGPAAAHLALRMPRTPAWARGRPALALVPFGLGAALAGLTLACYGRPELWKQVYLADTVLVGIGLLAIPAAAAAACWGRDATAVERAQGAIVLAAATAGIVPTLVVTFAGFLGFAVPGSEGAYLLTLVFPAGLAYAIVRWRLFDVEVAVKRTLVYSVVTAALAGLYFCLTAGLMAVWGQQMARWADVLAAATVAIAFAPVRDRVKEGVDRLFFRQAYDFRRILAEFAERARRTLDPRDLFEAFAGTVDEALHPRGLACYLGDPGENGLKWGEPPEEVALAVPVALKGKVGRVLLGPRRSDLPYKAEDRELVGQLAGQLALWLENADLFARVARQERIHRELEIAREVQTGMLPARLPEVPDVAIAACTRPALEVGGDFYDVLEVDPQRLAILVGDVSGKGVPAALLMAMTVMIFRSLAKGNSSPAEVLAKANDLIWLNRPSKKMFVTAFYAVLDRRDRTLTYANAGQPFPLTPTGPLAAKGLALGVIPGAAYDEHHRRLVPGETVTFFSDGVEDAINPEHEHFGGDRLRDLLERCWALSPEKTHDAVLSALRDFGGGAEPFDDLTLLTLRVR
ncbi:MAG: SpoIIE family protein phosphatase [Candidatus Sericytochromatia bacterium]|nr:SpoIIE family protein phosphatase [Candidatus Tanganyikabacteria bacterium]